MNPQVLFAVIFSLLFAAADLHSDPLKVTYLEGKATLKRKAKTLKLKLKAALVNKDVIQTNPATNVEISTPGKFKIRIMESSIFLVENLGDGFARLKFDKGNILAKVAKGLTRRYKLEIATPTGSASIRGTEFWGQVRPDEGGSTFAVKSGTIAFQPIWKKEPILISQGEAVVVDAKKETVLVRKASKGEMEAMSYLDKMDLANQP